MASAPPVRSTGSPGRAASRRTARISSHSARRPIGRLIAKIPRHIWSPPKVSIRPPRIGPIAVVRAEAAAQSPMARPRISRGYAREMMASDPGTIAAAPTPCASRAAIRISGLGAMAQTSEVAMNSAIPRPKTRASPKRSAKAPPTRISAERVTM